MGPQVNVSDRLRGLANDALSYYIDGIIPTPDEIRHWAERIQVIAAEVEQSEWDQYDAIIARDMEM